jgi:hypothetical protein
VSSAETGVPDLLRRFAPTPHSTRVLMNDVEIEFHTDDVEIVARMQPRTCDSISSGSHTLLLAKVVRDQDAPPGDSGVTIISAPPLTTLLVGTGTVLVLDCERREVLGFLASSVSAARFVDELLPTLLDRLATADAPELRERIADCP